MLWHNDVHRSRRESLYFWRLAFYPTYDRDAVVLALHEVLAANGVKSAVCYELFGPHDILLRVWLPHTSDFERFQDDVVRRLKRENLNMCDPFQVSHPVRHWLFEHNGTRLIAPSTADVEALSDELIAEAEDGRLPADKLARLASARLLGDFNDSSQTTDDANPGTKFAVVISGDPRLTNNQRDQFERMLALVLDQAIGPNAVLRVDQRSLYAGSGFGHFLVLGRVRRHPLHALTEDLLNRIGEMGIDALYGARTYTHVSGQRDFVFAYESLLDVIPGSDADGSPASSSIGPRGHGGAQPEAPPSTMPTPGARFDERFDVQAVVGEGGFSIVYDVIDAIDRQRYALKAFKERDAYEQVAREIGFLRKVEHPHVVRVYWADRSDDGVWYLVSEFVDGPSLDEYVYGSRRFTVDEAVEMIDELLSALEQIHPDEERIAALKASELSEAQFAELQELQDAGFVHRDIKPHNIIMTDAGLKLLDFNIASRVGDPIYTRSGTPPYQPPDPGLQSWDVSTDLFATGVVLYEMLCGEHPYEGRAPRADREPRDPRSLGRDDLSPALASFMRQACEPAADQRFTSATQMRKALLGALRSAQIDAHVPDFGVRMSAFLHDLDLTFSQLADRTGISAEVLVEIAQGTRSPTLSQARQIAMAFDITLVRLINGER